MLLILFRHRHASQVGAVLERLVPDAGDGQVVDGAGDGHRTARTGVTAYGDRTVGVRVTKLGLHYGGQGQQQ
jgi:hypothetical protein